MRWKLLAAFGWAGVGFAVLAGAGAGREGRFRSLDIEDETGKSRIALELVNGAPVVSLADNKGDGRLWLMVLPGGEPSVSMADANGVTRASMNVNEKGFPVWTAFGPDKKPRLRVGCYPDSSPWVRVYPNGGEPRTVKLRGD